jgi:hypothetical protein
MQSVTCSPRRPHEYGESAAILGLQRSWSEGMDGGTGNESKPPFPEVAPTSAGARPPRLVCGLLSLYNEA